FLLGRLQHHRPVPEARIIDQKAEWLSAEATPANVRMPVHPASLWLQAVVEVECTQTRQANYPVELLHRGLVLRFRAQRITGRKHVTRIQADAQALGLG